MKIQKANKVKEEPTHEVEREKSVIKEQEHLCSICENTIAKHAESEFIQCKKCHRWLHGYCVILTNEEVKIADSDEHWHCPGCFGSRKLISRLEKEPKAGQKLPGIVIEETDDQKDAKKKHPGRPTKPFFERADYKVAEKKEILRRLQDAENPELFEVRDLERSAGEVSTENIMKPEALMPYDGNGNEIFSNEGINCPVCQYPDLGRPLFTCVQCSRQFHKECLGIVSDVRILVLLFHS